MLPVIIFVTNRMNQGYASRNITHYKLILMHAPNGVADEIMPAPSDLCAHTGDKQTPLGSVNIESPIGVQIMPLLPLILD